MVVLKALCHDIRLNCHRDCTNCYKIQSKWATKFTARAAGARGSLDLPKSCGKHRDKNGLSLGCTTKSWLTTLGKRATSWAYIQPKVRELKYFAKSPSVSRRKMESSTVGDTIELVLQQW